MTTSAQKLRMAAMLLANSHILDKMEDHMRTLYTELRGHYPLGSIRPFEDDRIEVSFRGDVVTIESAANEKYRVKVPNAKGRLCATPRDVLYLMDGHYDE